MLLREVPYSFDLSERASGILADKAAEVKPLGIGAKVKEEESGRRL